MIHFDPLRFIALIFFVIKSITMAFNPLTTGIGAGLTLAGQVYAAVKGGQANRANNRLINQQEEKNNAWYNNRRNYTDTAAGKSAIEMVRQAYEDRSRRDAQQAVVTGATDESQIANKTAANQAENNALSQIAAQGTQYEQRNDMINMQNEQNTLAQKLGVNQQKAESAANVAGNIGNAFGSVADSGLFEKNKPTNKTV